MTDKGQRTTQMTLRASFHLKSYTSCEAHSSTFEVKVTYYALKSVCEFEVICIFDVQKDYVVPEP